MKNYKYIITHNKEETIRLVYDSLAHMVYSLIKDFIFYKLKNKILKQTDKITNRYWVYVNGKMKKHLFCYKRHFN